MKTINFTKKIHKNVSYKVIVPAEHFKTEANPRLEAGKEYKFTITIEEEADEVERGERYELQHDTN